MDARVKPAHDDLSKTCIQSIPSDTASFVPAARFCARGLKLWLRYPESLGVAERRETYGCLRGTRSACFGHARRFGGALRPSAWDARLPALSPWRFWAGPLRLPHRTCVRIGFSALLALRP